MPEATATTQIDYLVPSWKGNTAAMLQWVKDMFFVKAVNVFTADYIYFFVPIFIQTFQSA